MRALERSLGTRLLERGRFGAIPTPFGLALARHADAVDAELRVAMEEMAALRAAKTGHLCIGCGPSEATRLLPMALERLHERAPSLRVTVLYGLNEALVPWVQHGEIELALSSIPQVGADRRDDDIRHIALHNDSAAVVVRYGHPLTGLRRALTAADLEKKQWILARHSELERRALDDACASLGVPAPQAVIETTSTVLMKTMVGQTDFLTFLPRELIFWEERARQLCALHFAGVRWRRTVGVTVRARTRLSPATEAMIAALRSVARGFNTGKA
jgi:DNA-binding transcriptional LysR family regulator